MFMVRGTLLGYTEENREYTNQEGNRASFLSRKLHILDGVHTVQLELSRDFDMGSVPAPQSEVLVEVFPRGKNSNVYWTAVKVLESVPAAGSKAS